MNRRQYTEGQDDYDRIANNLNYYRYQLSLTNERSWLYLIECEQYNMAQHLKRYSR